MKSLTYAIGDIHGRFDLLEAALDWIVGHSRHHTGCKMVFLGDYVDRGPDSSLVIERLIQGPSRSEDEFVCLMGNHEEMLLDAQRMPDIMMETWLHNGGDETLQSYGGSIPESHLAWMLSLPSKHEDDHRFFVHAGIDPRRTLADQTEFDMLWIREPFLNSNHNVGKHVVHGHSPKENGPELKPFRTNLDTGAVWTGKLSVGVFDPDSPGGPIQTHIVRL